VTHVLAVLTPQTYGVGSRWLFAHGCPVDRNQAGAVVFDVADVESALVLHAKSAARERERIRKGTRI